MSDFISTDRKLFFSKSDPLDPRLGDLVKKDGQATEVTILGYGDDEGIRLNGGRLGAAEGPREIRHWLYRTTPHPRRKIKSFCDLGDLNLEGTLEQRHERAQQASSKVLNQGGQVLALGGGNDYAYSDGRAFLDNYDNNSPIIINIDAHLDVRNLKSGLSSGTPFFRLLEGPTAFDFFEIGIQSHCNSTHHWNYVEKKGGKIISLDELSDSGRSTIDFLSERMGDSLLRRRPAFLAIDIDAFATPFAAGSSASWPLGLNPQTFWPFFQLLLKRLDVRVLGIYEVSPPLDQASVTSKLAALFAHGFLHHV